MCCLDYSIWSVLQEQVWSDQCKTMVELRASVLRRISEYPQSKIDKAIDSFLKRVKACQAASGGYFEHSLPRNRSEK